MSNLENTVLLEFAYEVAEAITNDPSHHDEMLLEAIKTNDLDEVRRILKIVEDSLPDLSREHFHKSGQVTEWEDIY